MYLGTLKQAASTRFVAGTIVAALLVVCSAAVACGSDDKGDLEEYYRTLDSLFQDVAEGMDELKAGLPASVQETGTAAAYFKAEMALWRESFTDKLPGIEPPPEAQAAHHRFVETWVAFEDQLRDAREHYATVVESTAKAEAVSDVYEPRVAAARERFEVACRALQAIADDNGIDVNLAAQIPDLICDV